MNFASKIADKIAGTVPTDETPQPKVDESRPMNALVWHAKKDIQYVKKPRPLITDPTDIILRITATTICGSDLHLYTNAMLDMHDGDIIGHEFMGIVEEVGSQVTKISTGQRVVVAFDIACGKCEYCQREEYTACDVTNPSKLTEDMYGHRPAALYGYSHLTGGIPGGQAEYVRVCYADLNCLPIPDDVPDEKALYLSDVITTAYHGTELAKVKSDTKIGIWGLGPIGLMAIRWAQIRGASDMNIVAIDSVPERINAAKRMGVRTINFKEVDVSKKVFEWFPGGLDAGIECAGFEYPKTTLHKIEIALNLETDTSDILSEIIHVVRKFGIVTIIGVYTGYCNHFPIGAVMEKDLTINGGQSPTQKYWHMALEKIRNGELDPTFIITHKGSLKDGPEYYRQFAAREDGMIKVFLRPETYTEGESSGHKH